MKKEVKFTVCILIEKNALKQNNFEMFSMFNVLSRTKRCAADRTQGNNLLKV